MWQRFDEAARRSVFQAQECAQRFGAEFIDPDLLLLGTLDADGARVEAVLAPAKLDLAAIYLTVQSHAEANRPRRKKASPDMTLTPGAKSAIDQAFAISAEVGSSTITVDHLILGIASVPGSRLGAALQDRKVSVAELKAPLANSVPAADPIQTTRSNSLTASLAKMQPLDALAVMTIREIKLTVSINEAKCLQGLLDSIDEIDAIIPSRSGSDPIAETMADAVHLASQRREPLAAAHLLAAMYRRVGTIVNIAASRHYANPEEMMDRLQQKER